MNGNGGLSTYKLPGAAGPLQRELLLAEGIAFDKKGNVSRDEFWWRPDQS